MALKEIGAMVYIGDPILASSLVFAVEKKRWTIKDIIPVVCKVPEYRASTVHVPYDAQKLFVPATEYYCY